MKWHDKHIKTPLDTVKQYKQCREPLTEPHSKKFRTLDTDEVGLALISNCLCQQGLATACSNINVTVLLGKGQHAPVGWAEELYVRMLASKTGCEGNT